MITPLTPLSLKQGPRWTCPEEPEEPEAAPEQSAGPLARLLRAVAPWFGWRPA
jgi:hypothetical protein